MDNVKKHNICTNVLSSQTFRSCLFVSGFVARRLGHCATSRKIAGSIPYEVIGIFNSFDPSSRTMALGSIHHLTEMSTRNLPGGKGRPAGA
jgi:hypothetical protein